MYKNHLYERKYYKLFPEIVIISVVVVVVVITILTIKLLTMLIQRQRQDVNMIQIKRFRHLRMPKGTWGHQSLLQDQEQNGVYK